MTVETNITTEDWLRLVQHLCLKTTQERPVSKYGVPLLLGAGMAVPVALTRLSMDIPSLLIGAVVMAVTLLILAKMRSRSVDPAPDGIVLGKRLVTLNEAGIKEVSSRHETLVHWLAVRGVDVTSQHAFVMVDRNAAFILPKRDFNQAKIFEEFVAEVRKRAVAANS